MNPRRFLVPALLLLTATAASALTIVGHDPAVNNRFDSGYPTTPVENTSLAFLGNGFDLSGVGWSSTDSTRSFAMISDQYFVYAAHHAPTGTMNFLNSSGQVVSYTVSGGYQFTYNGQVSDFAVGMLSTPLNPADGIATYPILDLTQATDYLGLDVLIYGHGSGGPRLGANVADVVLPYALFSSQNNNYGIGYSYNSSQAGDSVFEGGDSSSPTFVNWYGQLALVGVHSAVGTIGPTTYSIDNLIAAYTDQMTAQSIGFTAVPEPARGLLMLLGACALLRRRQRARPHE
ncbi:MAG: PEP-CTERM sorting domain-containing protein [Prosthecobacter sp.]